MCWNFTTDTGMTAKKLKKRSINFFIHTHRRAHTHSDVCFGSMLGYIFCLTGT